MGRIREQKIPLHIANAWDYFTDKVNAILSQTKIIEDDLKNTHKLYNKPGVERLQISRLVIEQWMFPKGYPTVEKILSSKSHVIDKDIYQNTLDERINWIYLLSYAQSYEEFERFWKSIAYQIIKNNGESPKAEKCFIGDSSQREKMLETGFKACYYSYIYALEIANKSMYNHAHRFVKIKPVFEILADARHYIVHSKGKIRKQQYLENTMFLSFFNIDKDKEDGCYISMDKRTCNRAITKLLSLAYIYVSMYKFIEE